MEIYPELFPDVSQPYPSRRAEDRVFDANQDRDRPGFDTHEGQPNLPKRLHHIVAGRGPLPPAGQGRPVVPEEGLVVSRSAERPLGEALPKSRMHRAGTG